MTEPTGNGPARVGHPSGPGHVRPRAGGGVVGTCARSAVGPLLVLGAALWSSPSVFAAEEDVRHVGTDSVASAATNPATSTGTVRFETRLDDTDASTDRGGSAEPAIRARCVAIRVAERHLLTAAHCLSGAERWLYLDCSEDGSAKTRIEATVRHPTHDAVLAAFAGAPPCLGGAHALASGIDAGAPLTSRTLAGGADPHDRDRDRDGDDDGEPGRAFSLTELARDDHTLRLDDPSACLGRGDSGHPVFTRAGDGTEVLVAMVIGGTEGCPSLQTALRLDPLVPWIEDVLEPRADPLGAALADDACPPPGCLSIDAARPLCSIDPEQLPADGPFATKARLALPAGKFRPDAAGRFALPPITLESPHGTTSLVATGPASARVLDTAGPEARTAARLEITARYAHADGAAKVELVLVADAIGPESVDDAGDTAGARYSLGDMRDAERFLARGRLVLLRPLDRRPARSIRPSRHGTGAVSVAFAPCELPGRPDERFDFALDDGTLVRITLGATVGAHELGFYIGRPRAATIRAADDLVRIDGHDRLAFIGGSRRMGELAIPALAVRTAPRGAGCGYLFDASAWDTAEATDGYVAHTLDCDGSVGASLRLRSARYPGRYVLP